MSAARIMWGTPNDEPRIVDPEALARVEETSFTFFEPGETAEAPAGPITESEGGTVPADRIVFLAEDDGLAEPIALTGEREAGNADVLAAVEEEWRARTGRTDVRPDAAAEPPGSEPPTAEPAGR